MDGNFTPWSTVKFWRADGKLHLFCNRPSEIFICTIQFNKKKYQPSHIKKKGNNFSFRNEFSPVSALKHVARMCRQLLFTVFLAASTFKKIATQIWLTVFCSLSLRTKLQSLTGSNSPLDNFDLFSNRVLGSFNFQTNCSIPLIYPWNCYLQMTQPDLLL